MRQWVQAVIAYDYAWIIDAGSLIGHVRLDRFDVHGRRASLAIGIDDAPCLGKGIGPHAISFVLEYAFKSLKLHRVTLRVLSLQLQGDPSL